MTEYIKREEAIETAKHAWAKDLEPSQYIEIIPAADVAPARHGQWIYREFDDEYGLRQEYECSECAKYSYFDTDYCPNCGARMDEEVKHEC